MDRRTFLVTAGLASLSSSTLAGTPTFVEGKNMFVETGVDPIDRTPTWYASMVARPYAPVFQVLATKGTAGRYYDYTYVVTLKDMVKFHGHDCEGTTHAANNAYMAFKVLFPDGIIDRSVLWGISGTSPCWSDAVAFLTGARLQYGNLGFFKDTRYAHAILLYRQDTGTAVLATWKKGINDIPGEPVMLPGSIRWKTKISMDKVMKLKMRVKKQGNPTPYQLDLLRYMQWKHVNDILGHPLKESYQTKVLENFKWADWIDPAMVMTKEVKRSDVRYKDFPYRTSPVSNSPD